MIKNPSLLAKHLNVKEKQTTQQAVVKLNGLMFLFGYILAGIDYRYQLTPLPKPFVLIGSLCFLFAYVLFAIVIKENDYLSRTIEVQKN